MGGGSQPDARSARAGLACLAFAALLHEIALTRLSSALLFTHLTAVVIAACLAAVGLGAAHAHRRAAAGALDEGFPSRAAGWAALAMPLSLAATLASPMGFALGLFAIPFFWVGACSASVYVVLGRGPAFTYAAELLGGAAGAGLAPSCLRLFGDVTTSLLAATLAALAFTTLGRRRRAAAWALLAPLVLVLQLAVPGGLLVVDPYAVFGFRPHLVEQTRAHGGHVLATAQDAYARTDLVETDEPWVRYLFTDRMYAARVARWDGRSPRFADEPLERLAQLKGLPFRALHPRRVLVLGAGGGFDVALALQAGAERVDAVEINEAMIRFTRGLSGFCGGLYDRPQVHVHHSEARRFVASPGESYDLIDLSLIQTDPAPVRSNAGVENWVFTVEAIVDYLGRLGPGGALAVVQNDRAVAAKTAATVMEALHRMGLSSEQAERRLAVLSLANEAGNPFNHLVLVSQGPAAGEGFAALRSESGVRALDVRALLASVPSPAPTDDRPFFYTPHPALWLIFASAGLLAAALLILTGLRDRLSAASDGGAHLPLRGWLTASAVGAAFMLTQAGLIHRAQFLLGYPVLATALVVGGTLLVSGGAAAVYGRLAVDPRRGLGLGAVVAAGAVLTTGLLSPALFDSLRGVGLVGRATALGGMIALVAIPAGLCFPACLERFAGAGQRSAAGVYAADGLAAVTAAIGGLPLAGAWGIRSLFVAAAVAYLLVALIGGGSRAVPPRSLTP